MENSKPVCFPSEICQIFKEEICNTNLTKVQFPGGSDGNLPAMWDIWVQSLGWEDPLEKGMATHSSILAWRISWTEESGGLQSMESPRVGHD